PDRVKEHADAIRDATVECINAFIEEGRADLAADLAAHVPPIIIAKILGLGSDDAARFAAWTGEMNRSASRGDEAANRAAAGALLAFVDEQVRLARGSESGDLIAMIANSDIAGEPIPHEIAVGAVITLVVAGHETTVNGIASVLWLLGAHPDIKQRLIDDPALIPNAVEEALRLESPVQMMARTLTEDAEIDGIEMKAGDKVGLVWGAGNHDESKFADPDRFDIDRPANPHLAFGHGIHRCVGEHLARLEMRVAVEEVLRRLPDYRIAGDVPVGANSAMNRGPRTVPVTFTPAARSLPG
ncbi:MAG: cytochrome P450, partial [Frankia sp.]